MRESINVLSYPRKEFVDLFRNILQSIQGIPEKRKDWLRWLTSYQVKQLINNPNQESVFIQTIRDDFDELCEFDRLIDELRPYEEAVIIRLISTLTKVWKIMVPTKQM